MATARLIEIPEFDFAVTYYPDIYRSLILFQRINVPEITDERDEEPFTQLIRSFALTAHLSHVLLDAVANECLLPTSRLLESVKGHMALIDVRLNQATPASTDVILEFSKVFDIVTNLVPLNSQFGTEETDESPQIIYENNTAFNIDPTNEPTAIFAFTAGKIVIKDNTFDAGDGVTIEGVTFTEGTEWAAGGTIALSLDALTAAINAAVSSAILGKFAAINDGVDTISIIPLIEGITSIAISETDGATDNFDVLSGSFGPNRAAVASVDSSFFLLFEDTPKAGDIINIGHQDIMWDALSWIFDVAASGITFAVEFFDNKLEDEQPDSVVNLGSTLEFDATTLLGTLDRSGAVVRVKLNDSGASEAVVSTFSGGINKVTTKSLLGQSVVSTDADDYSIGSFWNEVSDFTDSTSGLTADAAISYTLPQSLTENWNSNTVNNQAAFWLRLRVISVSAPTNPSVDRIRIDTGKQFLKVPVSQGQTTADDPLGSSNGAPDQEFVLTQQPLIEATLIVEIDEGSGFSPWNSKENFLSSNSGSKDYTADIAADDTVTITFGDGISGKIPSPGVDNIRAIYRVGADIDGNVGANTIKVNKSGINFLNRVFNPRQATGHSVKEGSTEQDLARIKIEGPATLRVRNRAITTDDAELLAIRFIAASGSNIVGRALGIEETFGPKSIELVVVGLSANLLTEAERTELETFFNGDAEQGIEGVVVANHEVRVVNYTPKIIPVTADVIGGNKAEIENAISGLLNPNATFNDGVTKRWNFADEVPDSVIIAEIFEVDPNSVKKVTLTLPPGNTILDTRELPVAGAILVTVT